MTTEEQFKEILDKLESLLSILGRIARAIEKEIELSTQEDDRSGT
jgi:hypothetical protein